MSADTTDGRVRRGARNRERIVDALIELVREGDPVPTAEQVAGRAGVGTRTVFRHFADMESLFGEMTERVLAEVRPLASGPLEGPLEKRVTDLVRQRAAVFDRALPFKRAGDTQRWRSEVLRRQQAEDARFERSDLLARIPELAEDDATAEAAHLVTSLDAWDRLRRVQRLGRDRAQKVVERALLALLDGSSGG